MMQEAARQLAAVVEVQPPQRRRRRRTRADSTVHAELHVPAQVELVGDVVEVAEVLGLAGEALLPVPLLEQLLGEGVAVGDALGVEAGARVAVPVPGAAEVVAGLEHGRAHAELEQPVQLVDAADTGADDDHLVLRLCCDPAFDHVAIVGGLPAPVAASAAGHEAVGPVGFEPESRPDVAVKSTKNTVAAARDGRRYRPAAVRTMRTVVPAPGALSR